MTREVLYLKMDNCRGLVHILKAINFRELATIFGSKNGLKVTVEDSKCVQANAFLQHSLFQEFRVTQDQVTFMINLQVLLECLAIFGSSASQGFTSLVLSYCGEGSTLDLLLEESGVVTECKIKTIDASETLDFNFINANVINKIIMKSDCLKDAFAELDMSSEVLELTISPTKPHLRLTTFGLSGTAHYDFPRDSDMTESFQCADQPRRQRYRLTLLRPIIRALALSTRVSLRTDDRGFLSLQYMIPTDDGQISFVEFFCVPDEDEETEDNL